MDVLTTIADLHAHQGCGLVPTMGALHRGHCSLIEQMRVHADDVVVSIFVNPAQFEESADLERYPRTLENDLAAAEAAGATAVFAPDVDTVYPEAGTWQPPLPDVADGPELEDAHRPGHFAGVCKVVARLFDLAKPSVSIFGEKDWQQMRVLESMVSAHADRWPGLRLLRGATVREDDGLAMSSRNVLLGEEERERALGIIRALKAATLVRAATRVQRINDVEAAMHKVLAEHELAIEYAVIRDETTLEPLGWRDETCSGPIWGDGMRLLIAARIGHVRL
ncbi:MAG: pantoate--beta-alanine ligase, partial [Phycisphaerales bacterium]|nr:pantoate--beta-alanine ligase [Phycisphaerales bacterium]